MRCPPCLAAAAAALALLSLGQRVAAQQGEPLTPTVPAQPLIGSVADVPLTGSGNLGGIALSFQPSGTDSIQITVKLNKRAWLGFGLSAGSSVSMSGGGSGSDVVVCSDGSVRRYWVTSYSFNLQDSQEMPGATCEQAGGSTSMTFVRNISAEGGRQRALTLGTVQQVIFAHGDDGATGVEYHGSRAGGQGINFSTGATERVGDRSGEGSLLLHLTLMSVAWGGCLPFGAIIARHAKHVPDAPKGAWFRLHVRVQAIGWVLQLAGLGAGVMYCAAYASHFAGLHARLGAAVVAIGTLQPLNAALRPHAAEKKSYGRIVFEVVHRGLGWLAVILGMANVWMGIIIIRKRHYDIVTLGVAVVVALCCMLPVLAFLAASCCCKNNRLLRWLTGADVVQKAYPSPPAPSTLVACWYGALTGIAYGAFRMGAGAGKPAQAATPTEQRPATPAEQLARSRHQVACTGKTANVVLPQLPAISVAARGASYWHVYEATGLYRPTWCHRCGAFLWGLRGQGCRCSQCRATACASCAAICQFCPAAEEAPGPGAAQEAAV